MVKIGVCGFLAEFVTCFDGAVVGVTGNIFIFPHDSSKAEGVKFGKKELLSFGEVGVSFFPGLSLGGDGTFEGSKVRVFI